MPTKEAKREVKTMILSIPILALALLVQLRSQETFLSACTENDEFEFIFIKDALTFDEGSEGCNNLSPSAQLASIPDEPTESFVEQFLNSIEDEIEEEFIWFGLASEEQDSREPEDFFFIDGTQFVGDFAQSKGRSPWRNGRPNGDDQQCVM